VIRASSLALLLAVSAAAQNPFVPLNLNPNNTAVLDQNGARQDWVLITNKRMEMTGKTLRVALEGGGLTVVILAKGVEKARHAKPILTGKGEYAELFKQVTGLGFNRIIVRNPDTGGTWGARLEQGKPILEN
jgi:hypothetical protein